MIQVGTNVIIADNTGAKKARVFKVLGGSKRRYASLGDIVVLSIKSAEPRKAVKKKGVHKAVVVRTKMAYRRKDGSYIRFDDNAVVILEKEMKSHAKKHEFELAEIAKRKIFALNHINDVALIKDESLSSIEERVDGAAGRVRIESYDIAHLSGKNTVGVMTVVTNGRVDKAEYRKFIIRSGKGNDDYGNLKEVLTRRLNHPEWPLPNLIVIDGGLGQYNAACEIVQGIDLVSVIKDEKHKPKGIHGDPEIIKKYKKDILLANNESHRFAITFHKQKRSKDFLG